MDKFKIVCIGGGSIRGLCELGALHYFYTEELLDYNIIHTYIGTSIGAAICLLLSIGYSPMDLFIQASKIDSWIDFDFEVLNFLDIKNTGGILDICNFTKHVEDMIKRKLHFIPTMKQIYDLTGKHLIITTVNVTKRKMEYLDHKNYPNMSCIDALNMSCAMPIIFS